MALSHFLFLLAVSSVLSLVPLEHLLGEPHIVSPKHLWAKWDHTNRSVPLEQWIVHLKPDTNPQDFAASHSMEPVRSLWTPNLWVMRPIQDESNRKLRREELARNIQKRLDSSEHVHWAEQDTYVKRTHRDITDPSYPRQWHLSNSDNPGNDANVKAAWDLGLHGEGVQVCVIDVAVQKNHPDLAPNFIAEDSYDFVSNDADPSPNAATEDHGSSCAGLVAARDDGVSCGVGVAYRANLAGIRYTAGPLAPGRTDSEVFLYHNQKNDIYSCSFGIDDCFIPQNVPVCDQIPLSRAMSLAFQTAAKEGRGGKGSIFVWAAGNERQSGSNVNNQDTLRSIYVINIAAFGSNGKFGVYSVPGCALTVSSPSNGLGTLGITTTDLVGAAGYSATDCTNTFGGTSAATPIAAGVIALMLQKNPDLTWRDVQDILAQTANQIDKESTGWQKNGKGLFVSHDYGFGAIDAEAAVKAAADRTNHLVCDTSVPSDAASPNLAIPDNNPDGVESKITVSGVNQIVSLEHTIVTVSITHPARGDLQIVLISPSGTQSVLAKLRNDAGANYDNWDFRTNFNWDESPNGEWTLKVSDLANTDTGTLTKWQLRFYGKCPGEEQTKSKKGLIAGVVIGVIAGVALVGIIGFIVYRKKQGKPILPFSSGNTVKNPTFTPQQQQPQSYVPQQPQSFAPQQSQSYAPQQPQSFAPQQSQSYAPQRQPQSFAPQHSPSQQMYPTQQASRPQYSRQMYPGQ